MHTDAKMSAMTQKALEKDAAKLDKTLAELNREKKAASELQRQADMLQKELDQQSQSEMDYLSQIESLQLQLFTNRKDTGNNMMSRIRELESMLAAEKRKASELQPINSISETVGVSHIRPVKAANSSKKRKKAS